MTPGTPGGYDEFEGDTGNSKYLSFPCFQTNLVWIIITIGLRIFRIPTLKMTHTALIPIPYTMKVQMFDVASLPQDNHGDSRHLNESSCSKAISSSIVLSLLDS